MYTLKLEKFEGPLDLLLNLIESEKLDISKVSLAQVADEYVLYLEKNPSISPEELADFLVIATKLLLIKSKLLIPDMAMDEEDSPEGLEKQLKIYREYLNAMRLMEGMIRQRKFFFWRDKSPVSLQPQFSPGKEVSAEKLRDAFLFILKGLEKLVVLPQSVMDKTVSLQEKIKQIKEIIKTRSKISFDHLMQSARSRTEVIVSFLALLELVKQQEIHVHQQSNFGEILIQGV